MPKPTYISSLITDDDRLASGLHVGPELPGHVSGPIFYGDIGVKTGIVFPDGTIQTSAAKSTGDNIDAGTW